jgi:hypothetical protein
VGSIVLPMSEHQLQHEHGTGGSTQEGIVVNLPSLRAEVPELDRLIAESARAI